MERNQHEQQMRMASEVAQVFLNSGTILIISLQHLTTSDFQLIRMHLPGAPVKSVWVGQKHGSDLSPDCVVEGEAGAVEKITSHLRDSGLLRAEKA